ADAGGVPVALVRELERDDPEDLGIVGERLVRVRWPPDDVGVHPRARDVLADLLDDQDVDRRGREARHPLSRALWQTALAVLEIRGVEGFDPRRLVVSVLDDPDAEADARLGQHLPPDRRDHLLVAVVDVGPVVLDGALVFAEPDRHHLEETGLDRALEVSVWIETSDEAEPV